MLNIRPFNYALDCVDNFTAKSELTKFAESRMPSSTGWVRSRVNFHKAPFLLLLPTGALFGFICYRAIH